MNTKKRASNIELLRLVAMFLIVWFHSIVHGVSGGFKTQNAIEIMTQHSIVFQTTQLLSISGKTGVALFVIISGYFLINSNFNLDRIKRNWIPTFFYSISGLVVAYYAGLFPLSFKDFVSAFLPIISNNYWFMTVYMLLILSMPCLNIIWHHCKHNQKLFLIGFLGIFNIILPSVNFINYPLNLNTPLILADYSSQFSIFIFYYYIGAYIKELPDNNFINNTLVSLLGIILSLGGYLLFITLTYKQGIILNSADITFNSNRNVWQLNSIFVTIFAISIFLVFKNLPHFHSKIINHLAKATFGIYLIHDNPFMRQLIWFNIFHMERFATVPFKNFIIQDLKKSCAIFIICLLIESIRIYLFKTLNFKKRIRS